MVVPVVATKDSNTGSSDAPTVNKPSGVASGDLLIAVLATDVRSVDALPTDWVEIDSNGAGGHVWAYAFYKVAGGSEPASYAWSLTLIDGWCLAIYRITGAEDPATNAIESANASLGSGDTFDCPSVTPSDAESLVMRIAGQDTDTIDETPAGETQEHLLDAGDVSMGVSSFTHGASPTGIGTFGSDASDQWVGITFAMAPTLDSAKKYIPIKKTKYIYDHIQM